MKRCILPILLTVALSVLADGSYRNRSITMDDGLTSNTVRNIVQDAQGFIWFGTDNGLCRYDGTSVHTWHIAELGINQYMSSLLAVDDGLYLGTEHGLFFFSFSTGRFEQLTLDIHTIVLHLSMDKEGNLWAATMGQGVWEYIPSTGTQKHYAFESSGGAVAQVFVDNSNQVWALTNWGEPAVSRLNRLHDKFEAAELTLAGTAAPGSMAMLQTRDGRLWLGSWEHGLLLMHDDGRLEPMLTPAKDGVGQHIHTLFERADGTICIGSDDGAFGFDPLTRQWKKLIEQQGMGDRFVYAITDDMEGGLWIGTFYGGVCYVSPVGRRFDGYTINDGLAGNVISRFCEDRQGRVWVASDDGGLMCFLPNEQRFVSYPQQDVLRQLNVHALCVNGDDLWIGTYTDGVYVLNTVMGQLRHYMRDGSPNNIDDISSYAIYADRQGRTWVGTVHGFTLFRQQSNDFLPVDGIGGLVIDIDEDDDGQLWISTQGSGLWHYNPANGELKQYVHRQDDNTSLPDDLVNCALVDESGTLWVGTLGGLCRYDPKTDGFILERLDVPSQNVVSIVEDRGALWLASDRGIVRYVPKEGVQRFTRHDGLVSEQFLLNAGMKSSDGRIFFGTTAGFNSFLPYQIKANAIMPPVHITSAGKKLELSYGDAKMLTLSFASLSYCSPEKNQYAYMLEGFDSEWHYVGNQHQATYTNLPAGTYTFRVRATNNDGVWSTNQASLRIVVHPPFWWSWWARTLYLLLIVALIWYYVRFRLKKAERQHQRELLRMEEQKEKEAREARLNFFTMIAHEIRTPVSLIIGPLEKLKEKNEELKIIDRNAHRLLELVNQLLDFRKVEQQSLVMHFSMQDICELLRQVSERFAPTFEQGGKEFIVDLPERQLMAMVDREGIIKVVSNLLTNANKYTKLKVWLRCMAEPDGEHLRLSVADDGVGIRKEDRQHIFDPFFQAQDNKPGTGIGLNIVKNIVEQHQGTIDVESEIGKGSTFTVLLPIRQSDAVELEEDDSLDTMAGQPGVSVPTSVTEPQQEEGHWRHTMLVVDDNEDMLEFLAVNFSEHYEVLTATDGVDALDKLGRHQVGVIVSDWMMPRMDGATLCQRVRHNPLTSHIPFIMLTAKTDDASKVESMNVGADVYIEKPFSVQYLEACIHNILLMRRRLMDKFSTEVAVPVTEMASNPVDNEFLVRMNKLIEDNLANADLNVNFLAEQLAISRSGLFAKIKSLTDVTPNEMIQVVRLKRAAQLLQEGKYLVSEVGYMVGFSNPSYFSKCFQKQFGMKPADYIKSAQL